MKKLVSVLLALALCVAFAAVCGAEEVHEHSWGDWQTQTSATCVSGGTDIRVCTTCGEVDSRTTPVGSHSWGGWQTQTAPTCTADGVEVRVCSVCGTADRNPLPATGHSWSDWATEKAATCTENGLQARTCSVCNARETKTLAKKGHTAVSMPGKAATCTESGLTEGSKCSVCGEILKAQETIPANGHTKETIPGKAATCTESGLIAGVKCTVCNTVLVEQQVIPAKGHTEVVIPAVNESCTETGLTEGKQCAVCGVVLVAQQMIPATNHDYEVRIYAPTTTSRGYTKHTCRNCGETYKDSWVAKLSTAKPVETPKPTAEPQADLYGSIVTNEGRAVQAYDCKLDTAGNLLEIVAAAEADGSYALRNLHISVELLSQLKNDGIEYIRFVVGDAAVLIPLSAFDSEDVAVIVADMQQELTGFVVTVDPTALTAENENGCLVSAVVTTIDDEEVDITAFVSGLQLTVGDKTVDVTENKVYPIG